MGTRLGASAGRRGLAADGRRRAPHYFLVHCTVHVALPARRYARVGDQPELCTLCGHGACGAPELRGEAREGARATAQHRDGALPPMPAEPINAPITARVMGVCVDAQTIKSNSNQRYASNGVTSFVVREIARRNGLPPPQVLSNDLGGDRSEFLVEISRRASRH